MSMFDGISGAAGEVIGNGVRDAVRRESYRIQRELSEGIAAAARNGTVGATNGVKRWAEAVGQNLGNERDLLRVHQEVAEMMRANVRRSFSAQFKGGNRYRQGQGRISGGILREAIFDNSLVAATPRGINFVDEGRLSRTAAHWARMNFGAKGAGMPDRKRTMYPIRFDDANVGRIGFNVGSRPAFSMPPGMWFSQEGKRVRPGEKGPADRFIPTRATAKRQTEPYLYTNRGETVGRARKKTVSLGLHNKPTRGIRGREFLNPGVRTLAEQLPPRYMTLMEGWIKGAKKGMKFSPNVRVSPRRGPGGRFTL